MAVTDGTGWMRLTRRRLVISAMALAAMPRAARSAEDLDQMLWASWRDRFLTPEGRVVDDGQDGISHSEGQGYGLLLAAAAGDLESFRRIVGWTERHLAVRRDPLLAWRWRPDEDPATRDYNNATDGDLFYAWALLRGGRRFGLDPALRRAAELAQAIVEICLATDPRGTDQPVLLPAAEGFVSEDTVRINPSYTMPLLLHELAAAFDLPALAAVAEAGDRLFREVAADGLVPDWIEIDATGWRPAPGLPETYGYDALRLPLFLVWSGRAGHPLVRRAADLTSRPDDAGVPVVAQLDGTVLARDPSPGYRVLARLMNCATRPVGDPIPTDRLGAQSYYPATLHLLVRLAAHESAPRCATDLI